MAVILGAAILLSIRVPRGFGGGDSDGMSRGSGPDESGKAGRGSASALEAKDTFPGVILIPDVEDHITLVPPLPRLSSAVFRPGDRHPLEIPFFGSYQLFKFPHETLPATAVTLHGNPDQKTFRSTDHVAMHMEAHQNLGRFFDASCCRAITVAVRNQDGYPGTLRLELELLNSESHRGLLLGSQRVEDGVVSRLRYSLPSSPELKRFDELVVRYRLHWRRRDHSAALAISGFSLDPR